MQSKPLLLADFHGAVDQLWQCIAACKERRFVQSSARLAALQFCSCSSTLRRYQTGLAIGIDITLDTVVAL